MSTRRIEAFLLRLVIEDDASKHPKNWRGRIQHVATGDEQKIDQLHDAVTFIAAHLHVLGHELVEAHIEEIAPNHED